MMNSTAKKPAASAPENYSPKLPAVLSLARQAQDDPETEALVERINAFCSIVDRPRINVVGVKVHVTPLSDLDAIQIVKRFIRDGTCKLIEDSVGNKNPGSYIAAVSEVKTGIDFTYIIGVEVEDFSRASAILPPNTVRFEMPAARYGKVARDAADANEPHRDAKKAISYLASKEFRDRSGYCYDKAACPLRVFDASAELTGAYEPLKIPKDDQEKYESIGWEIVTMPEIKVAGCLGDGGSCMENMFRIDDTIDWEAAGVVSMKQFIAFGFDAPDKTEAIFGRQVYDFSALPRELTAIARPAGLYVRFYQTQINDDNITIVYEGARDVLFFDKHPDYQIDYSAGFYDLFIFQYEQGASVYFPIKKRG